MFTPSKYQQAIFEAIENGTGDIVIQAVAGSGKTTTLVEAGKRLPTGTSALFCAFNKSIADTLAKRLNGSGVEAKTLHSLGKQALDRHLGSKTNVDGRKPYKLIDQYIRQHHPDLISRVHEDRLYLTSEGRLVQEAMLKLLDFCRLTLIDPTDRPALIQMCLHYDIDLEDRALDALPWLIDQDENQARTAFAIDFTDMIWLPVRWNIPMPTFQWVFVDEAQDLNACQLDMVLKCRQPGGRMAFCGDSRQAIYGFAGADHRSIPRIIERTNAQELPLSINYRCPTSVLKLAQEVVPIIEARPDAPEGQIIQIPADKLPDTASPGDMILCRLTAPLISECINFIKRGIPARVEGRDIGKQLTQIVDKVALREQFTYDTFLVHLSAYRVQQVKMLVDKDADATQITSMEDRCDAVSACYEDMGATDVDDLKAKIESLFAEERPKIKLATIHRAKGLESQRVFIVAPEKLPLIVGGWQQEQEWNLRYVAVTRAQETLVVVGEPLTPGPHAPNHQPIEVEAKPATVKGRVNPDLERALDEVAFKHHGDEPDFDIQALRNGDGPDYYGETQTQKIDRIVRNAAAEIELEEVNALLDQLEQAKGLLDPNMPDQAKDDLLRELDAALDYGDVPEQGMESPADTSVPEDSKPNKLPPDRMPTPNKPTWVIEASQPVDIMSLAPQKDPYIYGMRNRPAGYGTCPEGWKEAEYPAYKSMYHYGFVAYDRKLSPEELYKWEMDPVSANAYPLAVDQRVLVNDVDEGAIHSYGPRHQYTIKLDIGDMTHAHFLDIKKIDTNAPKPSPMKPAHDRRIRHSAARHSLRQIESWVMDIDSLPEGVTPQIVAGAVQLLQLVMDHQEASSEK